MYNFSININELPSRKEIINGIARKISYNSSVAIIGEPRTAKTNILEYISSPLNGLSLYGENFSHLIFSHIDCQMLLNASITEALFWENAILPIAEKLDKYPESLTQSYNACKENYNPFTLKALFNQLNKNDLKLILMLDEFGTLLGSNLDKLSFWGNFRSLANNSSGLIYVVVSRYSLHYLNEKIQEKIDRLGSPILNQISPVRLNDVSAEEASTLLGDKFPPPDKKYILNVAGGNLYLLQMVAEKLLDQYTIGNLSRYERQVAVGNQVYEMSKLHFSDLWGGWTSDSRKTLTTIALLQTPHILKNSEFQLGDLQKSLTKYDSEIRYLLNIGLILKNGDGYIIRQGAMLWWLADEISRITREKSEFEEWIIDKEVLGGLVSRKKLRDLTEAAKYIGTILDKGVTSLIDAYAKGLIK